MKLINILLVSLLLVISACSSNKDGSSFSSQTSNATRESRIENNIENTIFFTFNTSILSQENMDILDEYANWWLSDSSPKEIIIAEGHCDERGTREYNLALGEKRANSVKNYLIAQGIPATMVDTISYGKERPLLVGTGEEIWGKNRRVVLVH